jgi:peptide deformylase
MNLTLRTDGDECLRRRSVEVFPSIDSYIIDLVESMKSIMIDNGGVGLAAPQVGHNVRVILILIDDKVQEMINPEVKWESPEKVIDEEGCLSIPGHYIDVERSKEIKLKFQTLNGKFKKWKLSGLEARVVLHEIDHLDGVLMTDYE